MPALPPTLLATASRKASVWLQSFSRAAEEGLPRETVVESLVFLNETMQGEGQLTKDRAVHALCDAYSPSLVQQAADDALARVHVGHDREDFSQLVFDCRPGVAAEFCVQLLSVL